METLAENLFQETSAQAPPPVVWRSGTTPANEQETDFLVGESLAHLNPLISSLLSACTMLHTGVNILCDIEAELGVPPGNGIMAREMLPIENSTTLFQARKRKDSTGFAQAARFLGVMREGASDDIGYINNLQSFQKHHAEIRRLARQHTFPFLSQILPPQMRRT
jgi:hypothetical protein